VMHNLNQMEIPTLFDALPSGSFSYHATKDEMRQAVRAALNTHMERLPKLPEAIISKPQPSATGIQFPAAPKPIINAPSQRKLVVVPILDAKGWSVLDWANEAEVAYHTANDYLQGTTNPYRSSRLKLAKALGLKVEQLPG